MRIHIILFVLLFVADEIKWSNSVEPPKTVTLSDGVAEESTNDLDVQKILVAIKNRKFQDDDTNLLELMKKGVSEAAMLIKENPRASLQAAHKKAQNLVSNITASYTQAIFKAKSPAEAKKTLKRFQKIIEKIVDYTKSGLYLPTVAVLPLH
ncbi:uncharacterized protein LOC135172531 [Diachasmimorpha longicaudata]|uniref:uncharacterized protein LOC135172531 n=1 Tax=Diachasmimorpha longicaudata TaxID=58733 RepID=UPI0030B8925D